MNNKYIILLCAFGSGSKLLQAHLSSSPNLFTLPAYPLLYLPIYFKKWENDNNLSPIKLLKLIETQFASIFDTRSISGFNGTNELGKNKNGYIQISKKKFKNYFLKYFRKKNINLKNTIFAIHMSYQYAIKENAKKILYHPHSIEIFKNHLHNDFKHSKSILTIRDPILNFWRSAHADENIDRLRFDKTDYENLKNYRYINRVRDLYLNFKNFDKHVGKNCRVFRFEELKKDKKKSLKKICKFFDIKLNFIKMKTPMFIKKQWWGSNIYKGSTENYLLKKLNINQKKDMKLFSHFEILTLNTALLPFLSKFNYIKKNRHINSNNFLFWIYIFFPTKYGFNLFFSRFNIKNFFFYIRNCIKEISNKKTKNYYFNAMYKFKWSYRIAFLIKYNFLRKKSFIFKKNILLKLLNFCLKLFLYPIIQIELMFLYFYRIYLIIKIKNILSKNIQFMKLLKQ